MVNLIISYVTLQELMENEFFRYSMLVLIGLLTIFIIVMAATSKKRRLKRQNKMEIKEKVPKINENTIVIKDSLPDDKIIESTVVIKPEKKKEIIPDIEESVTVFEPEEQVEIIPDIEESTHVITSLVSSSVLTEEGETLVAPEYDDGNEIIVLSESFDKSKKVICKVIENDFDIIVTLYKKPIEIKRSIGEVTETSDAINVTLFKKAKEVL